MKFFGVELKFNNKDIALREDIPTTLPANGGNSDTVDGLHANAFARAYSSGYSFGGSNVAITTAEFITLLSSLGAFNQPYWISRGSWSYAGNSYINDTGVGNIHLAGCTVEVIGNSSTYTIRIHTPTTSSSGVVNGDFIYISNGSSYSPGWRRLYSTHYKPTPSDIGAAPTVHTHTKSQIIDFPTKLSQFTNDLSIDSGQVIGPTAPTTPSNGQVWIQTY